MKAHWVAVVAAGTLVVGLVTGGFAGLVAGLWMSHEAASTPLSVDGFFPDGGIPLPDAAPPAAEPLPQLRLEVFSDGCGVIRSETPPDVPYRMLTWVFRDQDGFQVLGRAAESETRYRYFQSGEYTVVLEAHDGTSYRRVSNEVTVAC